MNNIGKTPACQYPKKRVSVFIDGANCRCRLEECGWECFYDPLALSVKLVGGRMLAGVHYYTATPHQGHLGHSAYATRRQYLASVEALNGVIVRYGYMAQRGAAWKEKAVDVLLATDMVYLAATDAFDVAILITADADLVPAIERVRNLGKKVELLVFKNASTFVGDLVIAADWQRNARMSHFIPLLPQP